MDTAVPANLDDYANARQSFRWADETAGLAPLHGGAVNIAHEAVTRHVAEGSGGRAALIFVKADESTEIMTYADLDNASNRFARLLADLDVGPGARVFVSMTRSPALYVAAIGTWKAGAVFSPLFSAFGPEPIRQRMTIGEGAVFVTTSSLYTRRLAPVRDQLPQLRHVLVAGGNAPDGTIDLDAALAQTPSTPAMAQTRATDPAIIHFTSGTTGTPKGALHVHEAVVAHRATARLALDLHAGDVFWCTADPGWVTGTSYGIIAPLALGVTSVIDEADFDAERWYRILASHRVNVWYTAPTAVRMMMRLGADTARRYDHAALRFIASVGEPLHPQAVEWGREAFGLPINDNWWQTETGGIMIANYRSEAIKPGSMGRPVPGIDVAILAVDDEGTVQCHPDGTAIELSAPGQTGMLALRPPWPSMFRTYLGAEERYRSTFVPAANNDQWYVSGDLASRDADGYCWFVSRADDVIKSSGHLIGPFEVESVLSAHPAVAGAGVFGKPDETAGAIVKAVIALKAGYEPSDELRRDILAHARKRLGPAVAPREIAFTDALPQTRSGKIMRRLLRARELGLPEGDLSTLEPSS